ncbi:MAG: PstS family phosphate ABC transporter substrate-binding protein [Armatimonadota bacterium]
MKRISGIAAVFALVICLIVLGGCGRPQQQGPTSGTVGQPAPAAGGQIRQVGSTTLLPLAERWRSEFNAVNPGIAVAVSGGGSGTGIKALMSRSAEIANSSREIKPAEVKAAEAAGVKPVEHVVAYDGIAIIVNPANTMNEITLEKLSDLYTGKITKWDDLGATGLGQVQLINRDSSSGTYEAFKELVVTLGGKDAARDFAPGTLNQTSNQGILAMVEQTKGAIGYVGLGYVSDKVKVLKVIPAGGKEAIAPTVETILSEKYPISRPLYCYTNGEPTGDLKTYIDYVKSEVGQRVVTELGFVPIKADAAAQPVKSSS